MIWSKEIEARFWKKVTKGPRCWNWLAAQDKHGYGRFSTRKPQLVLAHRYSFRCVYGREPKGFLRHKCDNPNCVNPYHLEEGTQKENMQDCTERGRIQRGNRHYLSKLKDQDIPLIRKRGENESTVKIAKDYGVSRQSIRDIIAGRTWKHI